MNLAALLAKSAKAWRDRPAVALGTDTVASYGVLGERVARLAAGMRDGLGLVPGDRVAIAMSGVFRLEPTTTPKKMLTPITASPSPRYCR